MTLANVRYTNYFSWKHGHNAHYFIHDRIIIAMNKIESANRDAAKLKAMGIVDTPSPDKAVALLRKAQRAYKAFLVKFPKANQTKLSKLWGLHESKLSRIKNGGFKYCSLANAERVLNGIANLGSKTPPLKDKGSKGGRPRKNRGVIIAVPSPIAATPSKIPITSETDVIMLARLVAIVYNSVTGKQKEELLLYLFNSYNSND